MTKQEFQERVSKIAENLTEAMYQYNDGNIDIHTFKQMMRDEMSDYPYDWYMADEIDEECAGLTAGEIYEVEDTEEWEVVREKREFVFNHIGRIDEWKENMFADTDGVPCFVTLLVGTKGVNY